MWQKVAKFKGAEYFRKALYQRIGAGTIKVCSTRPYPSLNLKSNVYCLLMICCFCHQPRRAYSST